MLYQITAIRNGRAGRYDARQFFLGEVVLLHRSYPIGGCSRLAASGGLSIELLDLPGHDGQVQWARLLKRPMYKRQGEVSTVMKITFERKGG